jgi:hypothetical protein
LTTAHPSCTLYELEYKFELGAYGPHLWTREKAREIRGALTKVLDRLNAGDTLVIDTNKVEVFDYSFANEFFGKSLLSLPTEHPGRFIVVENLTEYTRENLIKALEGMGLAMIERKGTKLALLGKVHPTDEETFTAVVRAKSPATAAELKNRLEVNLNAINERLSKLTGLGLIRRERATSAAGREQFQYRVLS